MTTKSAFHFLAVTTFFAALVSVQAATVRLDELDLTAMTAGWGKPQPNLSITQKPLAIGGVKFEHGVGTHAVSEVAIQLDGKAKWFTAKVGVDDHAGNAIASVEFIVSGDDRELWRSGVCKLGEPPRDCRVKLAASNRSNSKSPTRTTASTTTTPTGRMPRLNSTAFRRKP